MNSSVLEFDSNTNSKLTFISPIGSIKTKKTIFVSSSKT